MSSLYSRTAIFYFYFLFFISSCNIQSAKIYSNVTVANVSIVFKWSACMNKVFIYLLGRSSLQ